MRLLLKRLHQFIKAIHGRLQIFNDIRRQHIGIGQAIQISQGLVLDPEDIQTGLVPFQNLIHIELTPAAIGITFAPCFRALMAVFRIVAADEIFQIPVGHGMLL